MLLHHAMIVTPFVQNCSIVWCDETMKGAVIDPGGDVPKIRTESSRLGVSLTKILLTHAHIDHAGGTAALAEDLGLPIIAPHPDDKFWIDGLVEQARMFRFPNVEPFAPTQWLHDGETVKVGNCILNVRHCPGHTPGHMVFYNADAEIAFVGDVLFAGGIGRTDSPRGDLNTLINSIVERLWPMGDDTVFVPGHGAQSTFGRERRSNPYVQGT